MPILPGQLIVMRPDPLGFVEGRVLTFVKWRTVRPYALVAMEAIIDLTTHWGAAVFLAKVKSPKIQSFIDCPLLSVRTQLPFEMNNRNEKRGIDNMLIDDPMMEVKLEAARYASNEAINHALDSLSIDGYYRTMLYDIAVSRYLKR